MYYFYGGLWCIVSPCFCSDGVLWVEASTKVACADCRRNWPLLIVHGLIWADNLGFFVADPLVVFELGAPFRLVPPVRILCFFDALSIGVDSRGLFLLTGCALCVSVVALRFLPPNMAALFGPAIGARTSRQDRLGLHDPQSFRLNSNTIKSFIVLTISDTTVSPLRWPPNRAHHVYTNQPALWEG